MINWIHKYYDSLKPYGLTDDRLLTSVKVLALIFAKRLFKGNTEMTFAVLKQVLKLSIQAQIFRFETLSL